MQVEISLKSFSNEELKQLISDCVNELVNRIKISGKVISKEKKEFKKLKIGKDYSKKIIRNRWTDEEITKLRKLYSEGTKFKGIEKELKRFTLKAIEQKIQKLGLSNEFKKIINGKKKGESGEYICKECNKKFNSKFTLDAHVERKHGNEEEKPDEDLFQDND